MESRTVSVGGTELHWRERGRGRPMVFLHGMADSHQSWLPLARAFPRRRLLLVDLPGHGLSGRPADAPYTPEWYGEVLGNWWDRLGLEDVDLLGHSYGGALAQLMLLTHAERVSTLTLVAPGGLGTEVGLPLRLLQLPGAEAALRPFLGPGMRLTLGGLRGCALSREEIALAGWMGSRPGSARALVRTARSVIDLGGQTRLVAERAHELSVLPPTALLWGDRDRILPIGQAHAATRWLRNLELRLYPGVDHWPHLERTREVARDVGTLLEARERRRVRVALEHLPRRRPSWLRRTWRWLVRRIGRAARPPAPRSRPVRPRRKAAA
jgi:pimeloyl-ACP methyl ester carboxylesterase